MKIIVNVNINLIQMGMLMGGSEQIVIMTIIQIMLMMMEMIALNTDDNYRPIWCGHYSVVFLRYQIGSAGSAS